MMRLEATSIMAAQKTLRVSVAALALSCLLPSPHVLAESGNLKDEFLRQYTPSFEKLTAFYSNVSLNAVKVIERSGEKPTRETIDCHSNGRKRRVDVSDSIAFDGGPFDKQVFVATPSLSFTAGRSKDSGNFQLTAFTHGYRSSVDMRFGALFSAPFWWSGESVRAFFRQPTLEITKIERVEKDGQKFVIVHFANHEVIAGDELVGWCSFMSDKCWALSEYSFGGAMRTPKRVISRAKFTYKGEKDSIPLLAEVSYSAESGEGDGKRMWKSSYQVQSLKAGAIPDKVFALADLGLATPGDDVSNHSRVLPLFLLGVLCILVAYFFWRRYNRGAGAVPV